MADGELIGVQCEEADEGLDKAEDSSLGGGFGRVRGSLLG
jgi:hypothetical protein